MKRFTAFASKFRINFLLSCGAAVLLTACGGNIDADGGQLSATAAGVSTDAGAASTAAPEAPAAEAEAIAEAAPAANTEAVPAASTETAPAASTEAASTAGAAGQAADVTTQAFELTGYDSNPLPPQTGQQDAAANAQVAPAPTPIQQ